MPRLFLMLTTPRSRPARMQVGAIARPNRPGASSACGALIACTSHLKAEGLDANLKTPGEHDPLEPE